MKILYKNSRVKLLTIFEGNSIKKIDRNKRDFIETDGYKRLMKTSNELKEMFKTVYVTLKSSMKKKYISNVTKRSEVIKHFLIFVQLAFIKCINC